MHVTAQCARCAQTLAKVVVEPCSHNTSGVGAVEGADVPLGWSCCNFVCFDECYKDRASKDQQNCTTANIHYSRDFSNRTRPPIAERI